jgi:hypothetical protein
VFGLFPLYTLALKLVLVELTRNLCENYLNCFVRNAGTFSFLQQTRSLSSLSSSSVASYNYKAFGSTADHEYFWRTPNLDPCLFSLDREDRKRRLFFPPCLTQIRLRRGVKIRRQRPSLIVSRPRRRPLFSITGQRVSFEPFLGYHHFRFDASLFTGVTRFALISRRRLDAGSSCDVPPKSPALSF